ncbi:PH domain-containing protein [Propionicicella superfundia]|uniref:PH domain-containing protein n=1 Tax=Propionicicella superfundia TaxID=348582 RepID=UPI000422E5B2|nr:PH domain-containing protein [Propionicicella superfundia]
MDDALFAPPAAHWTRPAPAYLTVKRITSLTGWGVAVMAVVIPLAVLVRGPWPWVAGVAGLGIIAWRQLRLGRWFRRWGYAEREDALYITSGLWWRSLTIVPYGRMQVVHVQAGPLDRAFGLAAVELVTASAESNARIPGLARAEAERLRDSLSERGESRSTGL